MNAMDQREYELYQIRSPQLREQLGIGEEFKIPVSRERREDVFGGTGQVDLDALVDDLHLTLVEHPEWIDRLGPVFGRIACLNGVHWGREGFPDRAAHYLELGLDIVPDNLSLQINHGLALCLDKRPEEALVRLLGVLTDPVGASNVAVRMLAARLLVDLGRAPDALELLQDQELSWPIEDSYLHYLGEVARDAGLVLWARHCPACGCESADEDSFCGQCGSPLAMSKPGS